MLTAQNKSDLLDILSNHGVLFGSKAFDLPNTNDYDYAITKDIYDKYEELFTKIEKDYDPTSYFPQGPEHGFFKTYLKIKIKDSYYDILIVYNEDDLDVIRNSVYDLQQCPPYLLDNKETRIRLYERALTEYGWERLRRTSVNYLVV